MECLTTSLDLKTMSKMVKVIVSTGSCPMETGQHREMRFLTTTIIFYQRDHIRLSDQSASTTKMLLLASSSTIRRGHYSGRLELLILDT